MINCSLKPVNIDSSQIDEKNPSVPSSGFIVSVATVPVSTGQLLSYDLIVSDLVSNGHILSNAPVGYHPGLTGHLCSVSPLGSLNEPIGQLQSNPS